ncbi:hypothetical protein CLCR_09318 [Cladophialophora carrionii]|uniref:Uncharacterized protein n=1 Tax=Cladophialophora carrionii TaxID=86049 RepID=A0A1C1CS45_9EURO|nr:hypothetical protein CLCR_09318 [Cladophialophora carrionii]
MLFALSTLLGFIGSMTVLFCVLDYAQNRDLTSDFMAFYTVSVHEVDILFPPYYRANIISDRAGPFNILAPRALLTGMLLLSMNLISCAAPMYILMALCRFFSGAS